jgi:hypothetical protein
MNDLTRAFAQAFDGQLELFDIRNRQYHAPGCLVLQRQASDEQLPGGQPIASTQRTKVDPQTAADGQSKLRSVDLALVLSNGDSNLAFGFHAAVPAFVHDHLGPSTELDHAGLDTGLFLHRNLALEADAGRRPELCEI